MMKMQLTAWLMGVFLGLSYAAEREDWAGSLIYEENFAAFADQIVEGALRSYSNASGQVFQPRRNLLRSPSIIKLEVGNREKREKVLAAFAKSLGIDPSSKNFELQVGAEVKKLVENALKGIKFPAVNVRFVVDGFATAWVDGGGDKSFDDLPEAKAGGGEFSGLAGHQLRSELPGKGELTFGIERLEILRCYSNWTGRGNTPSDQIVKFTPSYEVSGKIVVRMGGERMIFSYSVGFLGKPRNIKLEKLENPASVFVGTPKVVNNLIAVPGTWAGQLDIKNGLGKKGEGLRLKRKLGERVACSIENGLKAMLLLSEGDPSTLATQRGFSEALGGRFGSRQGRPFAGEGAFGCSER